jgi:hypothetical protein
MLSNRDHVAASRREWGFATGREPEQAPTSPLTGTFNRCVNGLWLVRQSPISETSVQGAGKRANRDGNEQTVTETGHSKAVTETGHSKTVTETGHRPVFALGQQRRPGRHQELSRITLASLPRQKNAADRTSPAIRQLRACQSTHSHTELIQTERITWCANRRVAAMKVAKASIEQVIGFQPAR